MEILVVILLAIAPYAVVFLVAFVLGLRRGRTESTVADPPAPAHRPATSDDPDASPASPPPGSGLNLPLLYQLSESLVGFYQDSALPADLRSHADFIQGSEHLREAASTHELLSLYRGDNAILACMALDALATRTSEESVDLAAPILEDINSVPNWTRYFALLVLRDRIPAVRPMIPRLLRAVDTSWQKRLALQFLRDFIQDRVKAGEDPDITHDLDDLQEPHLQFLRTVVQGLPRELSRHLVEQIDTAMASRVDYEYLRSVGKVWSPGPGSTAEAILTHDRLTETLGQVRNSLLELPQRSVLVVGENGVGKTTALLLLGRELQTEGWTVFEAGPSQIIAGQRYIGDIEERVQTLVGKLSGQRHLLWLIPEFHRLVYAGRHSQSPVSVLETLLPHIVAGEIRVVGECSAAGYETLLNENPLAVQAFDVCRIEPLDADRTQSLAEGWWSKISGGAETDAALPPGPVLREARELSEQFLGDQAAPGNLFRLLKHTRRGILSRDRTLSSLAAEDVLQSLGDLTGLPATILDERRTLDLSALRTLFERRVMGQPEAGDCLVERVAMIKAGVTDSTRPLGVFLFAGPTGTGKTEIAKTLAEFLFGSPERMIRVDMSELQSPESLRRLIGGESRLTGDKPLTQLIRSQPFSVILLDEIEKAHRNVWDLFLQVFDDGRLTDALGNTADFRHAIIIMTSNLGSMVAGGAGLGFAATRDSFSASAVERAVGDAFRPEFRNRIDRTVVFRPLSRETIREILHKELDEVMSLRGLRNRSWAVEWDEGAIEFLMEKGFTEQLGARPLKRAIDRYFLSPLAVTIVDHRYPEGDQFLFVRSDGERLTVEFVDPDAPTEAPATPPLEGSLSLAAIAYEARGTREEVDFLQETHRQLQEMVEGEAWQADRRTAFEMTSSPGFWTSPERFGILGEVELMDRIENGLKSPGSLLDRLTRGDGSRPSYARDVIQRIALQLHLVAEAGAARTARQPQDAFVLVEAGRGPGGGSQAERDDFARRLVGMYRRWGESRRMRVETLLEQAEAGEGYRAVLNVTGFGAYRILEAERGLHLWEAPGPENRPALRIQSRVSVVGQPDVPPGTGDSVLGQAERLLREADEENPTIVRRYREGPSPLVRDAVHGWRTGRLDRVLRGDFDLIAAGGNDEAADY